MGVDRLQAGNDALRRMQDRIVTALNRLADCPLLAGRLIDTVAVPSSAFANIAHGLGRAPVGWFVVSPQASATVWEDSLYDGQDRTRVLRLQASAALTTSIWVF